MKIQMCLLLIATWIAAATADAAQPQSSAGDISARVYNSKEIPVPSLSPGQWQSLTFDSERWDSANLHDTAKNSARLTAPSAGKYYIFAHIAWQSPIGTGLWGLRLQLNGKTVIAEQTTPNPTAAFGISMSVGTVYALGAGDYVEAQVFQDNGATLSVRQVAATSPEFGMARLP